MDDLEDKKRILQNITALVGEVEPNTMAAIAAVFLYKAVEKAVARGDLPRSALTEQGLAVVFQHTMFGSETKLGAAEYFELPILNSVDAATQAKKTEWN